MLRYYLYFNSLTYFNIKIYNDYNIKQMASQVFPYEYFIERSINLDRNNFVLPEYSQQQFNQIKRKLNIRKDLIKEPCIKATVLAKQEEIISTLFKYFNKITDKTYDKLSIEIFNLIGQNISNKEKVCNIFFQVVLNNSFFCHLYAKLYKKFIEIDENFENVLKEYISNYIINIDKIEYISPNKDYDKYCEYVKKADGVKNFTNYLVQCLINEIIDEDLLINIAIIFQENCLKNINEEEKLFLNEIYISNIFIIVKDAYTLLQNNSNWDIFLEKHGTLMETDGAGKNKKICFKLLDISEINNQ